MFDPKEDFVRTNSQNSAADSVSVWKYLVTDFLEMACFLNTEEQEHLLNELARSGIRADAICAHPGFSIQGKLVVICEETTPVECWLYDPKKRNIQRMR